MFKLIQTYQSFVRSSWVRKSDNNASLQNSHIESSGSQYNVTTLTITPKIKYSLIDVNLIEKCHIHQLQNHTSRDRCRFRKSLSRLPERHYPIGLVMSLVSCGDVWPASPVGPTFSVMNQLWPFKEVITLNFYRGRRQSPCGNWPHPSRSSIAMCDTFHRREIYRGRPRAAGLKPFFSPK